MSLTCILRNIQVSDKKQHFYQLCHLLTTITAFLNYRFLIRLKATLPNSANKLQSEFNIDATNLTMFYSLPKLVCLETYLRDFQFNFNLLNYITCTNILLKKMDLVESDLCTFCKYLTKEDIAHLFFSCSFSLIFWKD